MADDRDNEADDREERPSRRASLPRFGPFVTIAVAILMLFGAASRIGKTTADGGWFDFDLTANKSLERERMRKEEEVARTLITLGTIPAAERPQAPAQQAVRLDARVLPPSRGDIPQWEDPGQLALANEPLRMPQLSLPMPMDREGTQFPEIPALGGDAPRFDPAPEARGQSRGGSVYVVAAGDNWVKVGKQTGKRWQDIQQANPETKDGLRVGMRLVIP